MNIPNNDSFRRSVDKIPTDAPQSERALLDAIRNKFANNNGNQSGTSPPIFSIPNLKLPKFAADTCQQNGIAPSKLNQFILGQLSESRNSPSSGGTFAIPNLQIPSKLNGTIVTVADYVHTASENHMTSLNKGISDLRVCDEANTQVIDLTTALNRQSTWTESPSRKPVSVTPNPIDFQIPFIDCDLREASAARLPPRDEYCEADISGFVSGRFMSDPSRFGKITCLRYRLPKRTLHVDHRFRAKHEIACFRFETKSPDDIILTSLRKYNKT